MQRSSKLGFLLLLLFLPVSLAAQTDSLIENEFEKARNGSFWQFGSLWLTPQVSFEGIYDTNPIFSALAPMSDVGVAASPGIHASIPAGGRVLIDLSEQLRFQYYRRIERLRDIFNFTEAGVAVGGRRLLARVGAELHTEQARPTNEFDVLVAQKQTSASSSIVTAIGQRQQLTLSYLYRRLRLNEDRPEPVEMLFVSNLNRREDSVSLKLSRQISPQTAVVAEGTLEFIDFDLDRGPGDAKSIAGTGGLEFSPTGRITGRALLGYKRVEGELRPVADFSGLVGAINATMRVSSRVKLGGVYTRDAGPSALSTPRFFTEERYGGSLEIALGEQTSIRPSVQLGRNSYRAPVIIMDEQGQPEVASDVVDHVQHFTFTVSRKLTAPWILALDTEYLVRNSEARALNKDRFMVALSFSSRF